MKFWILIRSWQWETAELQRVKDRMSEETKLKWGVQSGWKWRWAQTYQRHFFYLSLARGCRCSDPFIPQLLIFLFPYCNEKKNPQLSSVLFILHWITTTAASMRFSYKTGKHALDTSSTEWGREHIPIQQVLVKEKKGVIGGVGQGIAVN